MPSLCPNPWNADTAVEGFNNGAIFSAD
jgi:hypothetical protein